MNTQIHPNNEAIVNFFADMIIKYGNEILAKNEAEKEHNKKEISVHH